MGKPNKKMSESELTSQVQMEMQQSVAYIDGELSYQRQIALQYYNGETVGDLAILDDNRSKVVSRDVSDTVEWILPALLKIFTAGDDVVRFEPQGPEDEEQAKQATEYCNWILMRDNPGFVIIYTLIKDALIQKNGIAKVWWEVKETNETHTVEGLDDDAYNILLDDPDVEIISHSQTEPPDLSAGVGPVEAGAASLAPGPLISNAMMHDVEYRKKKEVGKTCIENVPPEEFLISRRAKTIQDAIYVGHRTRKTLSDLIAEGYDKTQVEELQGDDALIDFNMEQVIRYENDLPDDEPEEHTGQNRQVWIEESYIRIDYDGDGIAEMRRVVTANQGKTLLKRDGKPVNEKWEGLRPFVSLTPIIQPHKFFGLSIADIIMDIQTIKSVLMRQTLDNLYLTNNPRNEVSSWVNMDDYLDSRVGGAIRIQEGAPEMQHVKPLTVPFVAGQSLNVLEYLDEVKSNRTGVTAYNQGIDANSLNKTASGISQIMSAAQQRIELIARIAAETGMTELFRLILYTVTKYQQKERVIRLRGEWVPMDPQNWDTEFDTTINVGLGTGNKDQMLMHLNNIMGMQVKALEMQGGAEGPLVRLENIYNTAAKIVENSGLKSAELYFTDPAQNPMPPKQPQPDPEMIKIQQQGQIDQAKLQMTAQNDQAKMQLEIQRSQADLALERERMMMENRLKEQQLLFSQQLEQYKAEMTIMLKQQAEAQRMNPPSLSVNTQEVNKVTDMMAAFMNNQAERDAKQDQILASIAQVVTAPKVVSVQRDQAGRIMGAEMATVQ